MRRAGFISTKVSKSIELHKPALLSTVQQPRHGV